MLILLPYLMILSLSTKTNIKQITETNYEKTLRMYLSHVYGIDGFLR